MTREFFDLQIDRLAERFGRRNFDAEFCSLAFTKVAGMAEGQFLRTIERWLGNRKPTNPPLLKDFEMAARVHDGPPRAPAEPIEKKPLGTILTSAGFPGCKSVNEAVEVAKHKNQIQRADDDGPDPKGAA